MGLRASEESRRFYAGGLFEKQGHRASATQPYASFTVRATLCGSTKPEQPRPDDGSAAVRVRRYFPEGRTA